MTGVPSECVNGIVTANVVAAAPPPVSPPLNDSRGSITRETGRVHHVVVLEDANRRRPRHRRQGAVDGTPDNLIIGEKAWRFASAGEEVRQCLAAVVEGGGRLADSRSRHGCLVQYNASLPAAG